MNRLISINTREVTPERLPPLRREGPVRALFININILGLKTVAIQLKRYCERHQNIDAVHIDLVPPLWLKVLAKQMPFPTWGWDFHSYRYLRLWAPVMRRWLRGPLPLTRFDIVQVMTQGCGWAMLDEFPRDDVRLVLKIDGTAVQDVVDYGLSRWARAPFIAAERRMFPLAELMVADTRWANRSLRDDFGIPENRIHRATNAVNIPEFSRWDEAHRNRDGPVRIVFVGNAWRRKGGDLLLGAHQRRLRDRAELHVFGKVAPADRSAKNVFWHGHVLRDTLLTEVLPQMDIFVLPSRVDMLPWSLVEAAATGLTVVAPRLAGFPEMVDNGKTGLLFERGDERSLGDALQRLVDDGPLRERLGRAIREHVRTHFDADQVFPEWLDRLVALVDDPDRAHDVSAWTPPC